MFLPDVNDMDKCPYTFMVLLAKQMRVNYIGMKREPLHKALNEKFMTLPESEKEHYEAMVEHYEAMLVMYAMTAE